MRQFGHLESGQGVTYLWTSLLWLVRAWCPSNSMLHKLQTNMFCSSPAIALLLASLLSLAIFSWASLTSSHLKFFIPLMTSFLVATNSLFHSSFWPTIIPRLSRSLLHQSHSLQEYCTVSHSNFPNRAARCGLATKYLCSFFKELFSQASLLLLKLLEKVAILSSLWTSSSVFFLFTFWSVSNTSPCFPASLLTNAVYAMSNCLI